MDILRNMPKHSNVCYSPDGKTIGVAGDVSANIYDAHPEELIHIQISPQYESGLRSVSCSPDNQRIVTAGDKSAAIWDAKGGRLIRTLAVHHQPGCSCIVTNASFSFDGKYIVSAGTTVQLWDSETGALIRNFGGFEDVPSSAIFSPDSQSLIIFAANFAVIYDVKTGKLIRKFKNKRDDINDLYLSPDGKHLAISYGEGYKLENSDLPSGKHLAIGIGYGNELKIWDLLTGRLIKTFPENRILAFSADSRSILTANEYVAGDTIYSQINLYDLQSDKSTQISYEPGKVIEAAFSKNGDLILASADKTKLFRKSKDGNWFGRYLRPNGKSLSAPQTVGFDRNEKNILSTTDGFVNSVDAHTGNLLQSFGAHNGAILGLAYTPDGKSIITFSENNEAKIWDSKTLEGNISLKGRLRFELKGNVKSIETAIFSPDGQSILTMEGLAEGNKFNWKTGSDGKDTLIYNDVNTKIWSIQSGKWEHVFPSKGKDDYSSYGPPVFSPGGNIILTSGGDNSSKIWESKSGKLVHTLKDTSYYNDYNIKASFSPDGEKIATLFSETIGEDYKTVGIVKIWDVKTGKLITSIDAKELATGHNFSPDGTRVIITYPYGPAKIWDVQTGKLSSSLIGTDSLGSYADAKFSPAGMDIIVNLLDKNETKIYDVGTGKMLRQFEGIGCYSPDGKTIVSRDKKTAKVSESKTGKLIHTLSGNTETIREVFFSPNGKNILTYSNDKTTKIWNSLTGKLISSYTLKGNFEDIHWDAKRILSTEFSRFILTDLESGNEIASWVDIDSVDWIVTHPSGLFDASPGAMNKLYFVQGLDIVEFSQLKERYYEPGLWKKVMSGEKLRDVLGMKSIDLPPDVHVGEVDGNGYLPIELINHGGGIGEITIYINGKEVIQDAREKNANSNSETMSFKVFLGNNKNLIKGEENLVSVKAWNADHWVVSRSEIVSYKTTGSESYKPAIHILTCGVSDYTGSEIDLKYAAKDAEAISKALQLGAKKLFGIEKSYVYNLTTLQEEENYPTKINILKSFEKISNTAHPLDLIVVYLSGHGINYGGQDGDWHYLTQEAYTGNAAAYGDPAIRHKTTLSSNELVELFKKVPALKQVLIIDACASGRVVENLMAKKDIESSTLRALDRMRDRTGMHIITGCTADAVSYEASKYGQGVLTYSLLEGIRGAALREDQYIDVNKLFQYAQERVPNLAEGIGGIQSPQIFSPQGAQSFDIGQLSEIEKKAIPISAIRPVYIRSNFQDENELEDVLGLGNKVDEALNEASSKGTDKSIIFVDVRDYPDGCKLIGRYSQANGMITLKLRKKCGDMDQTFVIEGKDNDEIKKKVLNIL